SRGAVVSRAALPCARDGDASIREAKSLAAELLEESLVLGLQVLDGLFLLAADPSDQQEQEELNRERHRARTLARLQRAEIGVRRRDQVRSSPRFRRRFASAEFWHHTRSW